MQTNRSVDRALDILYLLSNNNKDGFTFSQISRHLVIAKSSLSTLLSSLVSREFIFFNAEKKKYFLGETIFNLGNRFIKNADILSSIEGIMTDTVKTTGYTSFFGVLSGNEVQYLLRKVSQNKTGNPALPQYALKAYCTGIGKAMLLDMSFHELETLFTNKLHQTTKNSITSIDALYQQLLIMKESDITYEKEESSIGVQCRATPIRFNGKIIAAVSISFPTWVNGANNLIMIQKALLEERERIEALITENPSKWIFSSLN